MYIIMNGMSNFRSGHLRPGGGPRWAVICG